MGEAPACSGPHLWVRKVHVSVLHAKVALDGDVDFCGVAHLHGGAGAEGGSLWGRFLHGVAPHRRRGGLRALRIVSGRRGVLLPSPTHCL